MARYRGGAFLALAGLVMACIGVTGVAHAAASVTFFATPGGSSSAACSQTAPCSLSGAQARVRSFSQSNAGADVTVLVGDGMYRLSSGLEFGTADSGSSGHPVVWRAAPGAHPVVSGGYRATGWAPVAGTSLMSAKVPAGTLTRQVYINGADIPVAQASPSSLGWKLSSWDSTGFQVSDQYTASALLNMASGLNSTQVGEIQFEWSPMAETDWASAQCPVDGIVAGSNPGTATVKMAQPCWNNLTNKSATVYGHNDHTDNVSPYNLAVGVGPTLVKNARAWLRPGQWYLDNSGDTLYYQPVAGQQMSALDVEVPQVESLVSVAGTLNNPVHDLTFAGIRFTTATWNDPSGPTGFAQVQAGLMVNQPNHVSNGAVQPATQGECGFATPAAGSCPWGAFAQPLANIQLTAARNVQFLSDRFDDLGGTALGMKYGSSNNTVRGSLFSEIGAAGVWLGCAADPTPGSSDDPVSTVIQECSANPAASAGDQFGPGGVNEIMTGNTIDNNVLRRAGIDYLGTVGVTMMFTRHSTISHNDIAYMPYDGLTSGAWEGHTDNVRIGPTRSDQTNTNINSNNVISDNHIHNNMQVYTGDGGALYSEGHQGATVLNSDGSADVGASYANGLAITGNVLEASNRGYAYAADVGSQWVMMSGNVEFHNNNSFSCNWPTPQTSRLTFTGNWAADSGDGSCGSASIYYANTSLRADPGPSDLPSSVLSNAGPTAQYQDVEAALPPRADYVGFSSGKALLSGSGFTPGIPVYVKGTPASGVTYLSGGFLTVPVPSGTSASDITVGLPTGAARINDTDASITYNGYNLYSNRGYGDLGDDIHYGAVGATATYAFTGTGIQVFGEQYTDQGTIGVSIDGGARTVVSTVPADGRRHSNVPLYTKTGLAAGSHTVVVTALTGTVSTLDGFAVLSTVRVDDTSQSIAYDGFALSSGRTNLGDLNSDVHFATANGSTATFTFTGTGIQVFGEQYTDQGVIGVTVDGGAQTIVSAVSSDGQRHSNTPVYTTAGLPFGAHTVTVTKLSGTYSTIDGFQVLNTGRLDDTDPAITYDGFALSSGRTNLGDLNSDVHFATANGSTATFTFTGTGIQVFGEQYTDQGAIGVSIDGGAQTVVDTVPADGQRHTNVAVHTVTGLDGGIHSVVVTKLSGTYATLDGFTVAN
ncbi:hypothetical protein AB0M29_36825 [Streptomyces sp. NPDC051976]|uniref:hypothetical protein n=1 Tax=Streptomyces sp. NPDC051976 TaxID=3154947 RepID=UPI003431C41A